ncbi:ATP-binding protein [Trichocoleus sp. DQ-A3]|uniref:ATP-binding protein n=1 Tax=Coleofasciculus sp. FACHB-125 TaxID=2692784 RepID=UPI0016870AF3|nr:ATP-binding protein [Coleofasciculus sp. FACHB-125]MBD1899313.1 ATP-binding protein [Coleofasciculus sp. FACHB-125]
MTESIGKSMLNLSPGSSTDTGGGLPTSQGVLPEGFYTWERDAKAVNLVDLSAPFQLVGRQGQFQRITQVLARDGDLLITGVPGSGRRTLVRRAAQEVGIKIVEVDCIRVTDGQRFVQLLCESIDQTFQSATAQAFMREWIERKAAELFVLQDEGNGRERLKPVRVEDQQQQWSAFEVLLDLLQGLAESSGGRVVLILESFPHIRSWDRNGVWETFLRREIERQTQVSYVLVATIAEISLHADEPGNHLEIVKLAPLANDVVAAWVQEVLHGEGLTFDPRSQALELFVNAVQGHLGDASALVRRLKSVRVSDGLIRDWHVQQAIQELLADLSMVFESLLMLLPANQTHLLESLALDPTDKPQSRDYIHKHCLSRGGSLQGAIAGLQHKGLIYGSEQGYRLALPLFALWLRQRLS